MTAGPAIVRHFSEDPSITEFVPHVAVTNPTVPPGVWAVEAEGQLVSSTTVRPISVEPVGDLLDLHVAAGIELRLVPTLWPLRDAVVEAAVAHGYEFSMVRMHNAAARL